jgi:hypothetical protein
VCGHACVFFLLDYHVRIIRLAGFDNLIWLFLLIFFPDFIILQFDSWGLTIINFFSYYIESLIFFKTRFSIIFLRYKEISPIHDEARAINLVQTIFHPIPNCFFFFLAFISMPPISPRKCCLSTTNNFLDYILELKEISLIDKTKSIITIQHNLIPIAW